MHILGKVALCLINKNLFQTIKWENMILFLKSLVKDLNHVQFRLGIIGLFE